MDIMEEINKKRRGEEITKESVSEIMKEMAPDMTEALKDYAPVIDQVIQDFGVSSEYGIYEEDGHMFMCIPTSAVDLKSVDGYTYTTEGGFTIIQLDAVNKEAGCATASTSGFNNPVYSKKPTEKSKVSKSYVVVYYNEWGRENALLSKYQDYVVDFMDYTQPLDDVGFFDSESEAQKVANKVKRKFPAGDYRVVEVNDLSEPLKNLLSEKGLLKSKTEKSYEDLINLDYEGLKDLCNSMDSDATEKITREYEAGYIGEADAIGRLTLLAMKSDAEGLSLMNKSKTKKALVEGETIGGLPYDLNIDGHLLSTNSISSDNMYDCHYGRYAIDHSDDLWLDIESWHHGKKYRINSTPGINYPTPKAEFDSWEGVENYVRTYFLNR